MMRDGINTIKQLPNGVLALYKLNDKYCASYDSNRLVTDFMRNKFIIIQMDSEEELTKSSWAISTKVGSN